MVQRSTQPTKLSARRPALLKLAEALSDHIGVPPGDEILEGVAVAFMEAARSMYQVTSAGHGSVKIYIEKGWVAGTAMELTSLPDPENRRPNK